MVSGVEKTMTTFVESSKKDQCHSSAAVGIGSQLRKARESRQLSQMDVAEQLYLDENIVSALERDDYGALPEAIFVKGYIRNYSRLVGLNPDTLVKLYENSEIQQPLPVLENVCKTKDNVSEQHALPRWQILSLVAVSLVLLLFVYLFNSSERPEKSVATNAFEERALVSLPGDEVETTVLVELPQNSKNREVQWPIDYSNENNEHVKESSQAVETVQSEYVVTALEDESKTTKEELLIDKNVGVKFNFTQDSWVEVVDATGQRLYFSLAKSGSEIKLLGVAPFDVILGFAVGVTVKYNNKPFDLTPHVQEGVARFTLGKTGGKANKQ